MKNKILVLLVITLLLGGCQKTVKKVEEGTEIKTEVLAAALNDKYEKAYDYAEEKLVLERNEALTLDIGFDPEPLGMKNFTEVAEVFQDAKLTQRVGTGFKMDDERTEITILPPKYPVVGISASEEDEQTIGYSRGSYHLFNKGESSDWGNLQQYYLVTYVDLKTGEKLKKPLVTVFSILQELSQTLRLKLKLTEDGLPNYSWNKIPGAAYYYILAFDYSENKGYTWNGTIRGKTKKNSWTPEDAKYLRVHRVSERDRQSAAAIEKYGEGDEAILYEEKPASRYAVIAVCEDGTSAISNALDIYDVAGRVPYQLELALSNEREGKGLTGMIDHFDDLPSYSWVTMCDGSLVQRAVIYDTDQAEIRRGEILSFGETAADVKKLDAAAIPYSIEGTGFSGTAKVIKFDEKKLEKALKQLAARQTLLQTKAGVKEVELVDEKASDSKDTQENTTVYEATDKVTATSALSEYLAINMLSGNTKIDLKEFPEALVIPYLTDAWKEAVYQNPMILGAEHASISKDGQQLTVNYSMKAADMRVKQDELRKELKRITAEIITEGMTELEKEYAINQYLCDVAEYDEAALKNAEKNQFVTVDEQYNDSFTAYGVLLKDKGVCSSYSGAFKLLADEAGLDSIIVTGYLDSGIPHAWNKVKIDGEWTVLDSTNNDNEYLPNALLNVSKKASRQVLFEDDAYLLDKKRSEYLATDEITDKEFYQVEKKFYSEDKIAEALISALKKDGQATLRTAYDLDADRYEQIRKKVVEATQLELQSFYWMGVIYMDSGSYSDK